MNTIPELEPHCGSWIIVSKETGKPVVELFDRKLVENINQERYDIFTALQWLVKFNRKSMH